MCVAFVPDNAGNAPPIDDALGVAALLNLIIVENPIANVKGSARGADLSKLCSSNRVVVGNNCVGLSGRLSESALSCKAGRRCGGRGLGANAGDLAVVTKVRW